jgi:DNA polymerase III delta subunit
VITILHGDDLISSRKALEVVRSSYDKADTVVLEGKKIDLSSLKPALESPAFFSSSRLVVLENFLAANPPKKILDYLSSGAISSHLVIWEKKEISKRLLTKFRPPVKINLFKTPAVVFRFLDSLCPGNVKKSLSLLHETLKRSTASLVFYLLVRHTRELILVKSGQNPKLPWWKLKKLRHQAKFFSLESLTRLYRKLLLIDLRQKTGKNLFDLSGELEMIVLEIDESAGIS